MPKIPHECNSSHEHSCRQCRDHNRHCLWYTMWTKKRSSFHPSRHRQSLKDERFCCQNSNGTRLMIQHIFVSNCLVFIRRFFMLMVHNTLLSRDKCIFFRPSLPRAKSHIILKVLHLGIDQSRLDAVRLFHTRPTYAANGWPHPEVYLLCNILISICIKQLNSD